MIPTAPYSGLLGSKEIAPTETLLIAAKLLAVFGYECDTIGPEIIEILKETRDVLKGLRDTIDKEAEEFPHLFASIQSHSHTSSQTSSSSTSLGMPEAEQQFVEDSSHSATCTSAVDQVAERSISCVRCYKTYSPSEDGPYACYSLHLSSLHPEVIERRGTEVLYMWPCSGESFKIDTSEGYAGLEAYREVVDKHKLCFVGNHTIDPQVVEEDDYKLLDLWDDYPFALGRLDAIKRELKAMDQRARGDAMDKDTEHPLSEMSALTF